MNIAMVNRIVMSEATFGALPLGSVVVEVVVVLVEAVVVGVVDGVLRVRIMAVS